MLTATLFIGGLFPAAPAADDAAPIRLPELERILSRSQAQVSDCEDDAAWLCAGFNVAGPAQPPVAPMALLGSGGDPGPHYWFCADPAHLRVHGDKVLLAPEGHLRITQAEADAFLHTLNAHFGPDGFGFVAPAPHTWFLRAPTVPDLRTVAPGKAAGRDIDRLIPEGADRMRFHRFLNEVQMVLHEHPANQAREAAGTPVVNSIWLWGGGTLPGAASTWTAVHAESALLRGLCKASCLGVPTLTAATLPASGDVLVETGTAPDRTARLQAIVANWVAPLAEKLRAGDIDVLRVVTVEAGRAWQWTATRSRLRKFWIRDVPLTRLAQRLHA